MSQQQQMQEEHGAESRQYQERIAQLSREVDALKERLEPVERVHASLVDLYLDMKDRTGDPQARTLGQEQLRQTAAAAQEREQLMRVGPLLVIDHLRANLKVLREFKEHFENELREEAARTATDEQARIEQLEARLAEALKRANEAERALESRAREADAALTTREAQQLLEAMQKDQESLAEQLRMKLLEVTQLKEQNLNQKTLIKQQQFKLLKISQLESQLHMGQMQHQYELQKRATQHDQQLRALQKELLAHEKLEQANRTLSAALHRCQQECHQCKLDINRGKALVFDQTIAKLQQALQRKEDELKGLQHELTHARHVAETNAARNGDLKAEYDKLFNAVEQEKRAKQARRDQDIEQRGTARREEPSPHRAAMPCTIVPIGSGRICVGGAGAAVDIHQMADETPAHLRNLQRIIKEQKAKIEELSAKARAHPPHEPTHPPTHPSVRTLMNQEHRYRMLDHNTQVERARFERELAALKMQVGEDALARSLGRPRSALPAGTPIVRGSFGSDDDSDSDGAAARAHPGRPSTALGIRAPGPQGDVEALAKKNADLQRQLANVQQVAVSASAAYERLLQSTPFGRKAPDGHAPGTSPLGQHLLAGRPASALATPLRLVVGDPHSALRVGALLRGNLNIVSSPSPSPSPSPAPPR
ncbi:hypothetical protein PAPYR_6116 [Paratrimastix pyriformis]|uniref:Uncharacterized protein n=1 Tax=Paratrimastix pyriformis TaxID=342808 RepID=A0ABQ8UN44_9EUKA|nr:hypothetical protein PAPYR_6116 [Paratrimastix pyriformis]